MQLSPEQRAARGRPAALLQIALQGPLDEARLHDAVNELIVRHESLRTACNEVPGYRGLRQHLLPVAPAAEWTLVDLRGRPDAEQRVHDRLAQEAARPFDLAQGRLLRGLLFRLADESSQLVLMASPLAADRGSLQTMFDDLLRRYASDSINGEVFQYSQFVEWREALQADADSEAGRAYWAGLELETLEGPRLPYWQSENAAARSPQTIVQDIDVAVAVALRDTATAQGTALDTVLQAAWWVLLARISGDATFAGAWQHDCRRDYDSMAGSVGVYDKLLPLPLQIDPTRPWNEWLASVHERLQAHRSWQECFTLPEPDAPWRAGFACAALPMPFERNGLRAEPLRMTGAAESLELALQPLLDPRGALVRVALQFDDSRYDEAAARCLLRQYLTLIGELPAHCHRNIGDLPIGTADTASSFDPPPLDLGSETLPQRLARQAAATPDAIALAGDGLRLTYAELDRRVDDLAQALAARGVGAETIVALLLPRSVRLVIALLAVQRAGGAYLPLDPAWPAARRRHILADAKPLLTLCDDDGAAGTVRLSDLEAERPSGARPMPADIGLHQAAYLLYTSGSTGEPKGVLIEHGQLLNYVAAVSEALQLPTCRRFALSSTVAADLGNTTLFGAFYNGGCLVVAGAADMQDAASFAHFMRREAIDCLKIVPSHLEALLDADAPVLPRTLVLGGEATPHRLVERIAALAPDCRIFNHYGPTETTVGVLVHAWRPQDPWCGDTLPLSKALAGCRVRVLDAQQRPVPTGALGELHIGGAQLCRGVLNRPHDARFIDDPLRPGERLYRTGDLARCLPDGRLVLAGRADDELKIRGFRISPAEVESALLGLAGVRQAVVRAFGDGDARQLCAYIVGDQAGDEDTLRAALMQRLPEPMLPSHICRLPELPRLPNGKIDRQALPEPADAAHTIVPPRDDVEAVLAELCAELLGREQISVLDSFFTLGGHSLLVIKLVARIRKQLQIEIPPGIVFDHPSVAGLALALRGREPTPGSVDKVAALRRQLAGMTPQQRAELVERARADAA